MEHLHDFVLVKLEPLMKRQDRDIARRYGVKRYPALLLLDWRAEKKLGVIGDVPAEEAAAALAGARRR